MAYELVVVPHPAKRCRHIYTALEKLLGGPAVPYSGGTERIILWGPGGEYQQDIIARHRAAGGTVVGLDIGYFHREKMAVRLAINGFHSPEYLKYGLGRPERFALMGLEVANYYNPFGHVLICGTGVKSRRLYGVEAMSWERATLMHILSRSPETTVMYRPKPGHKELLEGTLDGSTGSITDRLQNCAAVYVQHSNVQVDALRYGVPCFMSDGILHGNMHLGTRQELLEAVSWFNWLPEEASEMLAFVEEILK